MGQCKSKLGALEETGQNSDSHNVTGGKAKKSAKQRKWRRRKGYSLSASLEGDLNCHTEPRSLCEREATDGPVLVSYNVWRGEHHLASRRNSYQSGFAVNELTIWEDESAGACRNNHQPLQHPAFGHGNPASSPPEQRKTNTDSEENDLVQSILTKNTQNSDVFISKEEPPCSTKTKTRIDNKSFPLPTSSEDSSVLSVSPTQGK